MVQYAYTLSSIGTMFQRAFFSIQTLSQYVDSSDIVVFFTPPRDDKQVQWLEELGIDVRLVENSTNAFRAFDTERNYGEKTWVSTLEDDTAVFLDCDTLVINDIDQVIQGDYQFKARPGTSKVRQPEWKELFKRFDEEYMDWMPNAGFLIFKEGLHREIGDKWRKYVQTDLEYRHNVNHKEQYALALAVGHADTERMSSREHVMLWNQEYPSNGIVYHVGKVIENNIETDSSTYQKILHSLKNAIS